MAKVAATSMNGERVIVIACGVGAILLCMTLIFIDLADLQDAWPVIAAVVLFVVFLSPARQRYRQWRSRRRAQKVWR